MEIFQVGVYSFLRYASSLRHDYFWNLNHRQGQGWYGNQSGTIHGITNLNTGIGLELKPSLSLKEHSFSETLKTLMPFNLRLIFFIN